MKGKLCILIFSLFIMCGCVVSLPNTAINVQVSRDLYSPRLDQSKLYDYKGQSMILDSIEVSTESNFTNFHYLSENKKIGYTLFYSSTSAQQFVSSFFWYTFQKAFENIGMIITPTVPLKNAPQLNLKILALTDEQAKLKVSLLRNGLLLMQKDITVLQPLPPTDDVDELEKRQYAYLDLMVETILIDPDLKREFFSDKAKI